MAIVSLKKITLCGLIANKGLVLDQLQSMGGTHLIPLVNKANKSDNTAPTHNVEEALTALKYLQQCPKKRHQVTKQGDFELKPVVQDVLQVKNKLVDLLEQREFLQERIKEVSLWGEFSVSSDGGLQGYQFWFYIVPKRLMKVVQKSDLVWQSVNQTNTDVYVVVVAKDEPATNAMPVPRTHVGSIPLSQLHKDLEDTELAIEDTYAKREYLTRWMSLIMFNLTGYRNQSDLDNAHLLTRDEVDVFAVQAWLPTEDLAKVEEFSKQHQLALLAEDPDGIEKPPTLLKNTTAFAGGEEVVKFYQMPSYYSWDPSIVVFFSFALFFAMILSDAGYAVLFMSGLALKWRAMGRTIQGVRFRMLLVVTLVTSFVWGVAVGSYFGFSPTPEQFAGKFYVLDMHDYDLMMRISMLVGVIHIALANLVHAHQLKGNPARFSAYGWAMFVIGGFLYWQAQSGDQAILEQAAYGLLVAAGFCILLFSGDRPLNRPIDYALQLLDGIKGLTGITSIFGNILSYMRLFALGLASASLAITFNQLAEQVYNAMPGMGLLFSILIFLIGHILNILLGILSGVVHGLRLNFIEFYNWSVSDEGYPFKVFSKKEGY